MLRVNNILAILSVFSLAGCGLGITYDNFDDVTVIVDDSYLAQWKSKRPDKDPPYATYLSQDPLEVTKTTEGELRVYDRTTLPRQGVLFLIFPIPIELSNVERSTEIYLREEDVYKIIYRNGRSFDSGFGFVCSPGFGGDSGCELL